MFHRFKVGEVCLAAALVAMGVVGTAGAFERFTAGCDTCHGGFRSGSPSLHTAHQNQATNNCVLCHMSPGDNPFTYRSGEPAPMNLGCTGCHGNAYGENSTSDGRPKATAKGLRQFHNSRGEGACDSCHGTETGILGENVLPPFYGRADVQQTDPCNSDGKEDFSRDADTVGLDNDGDGLKAGGGVDMGDPDCQPVTGCPTTLPGPIPRLMGSKSPTPDDALFSWIGEPYSGLYRVYSVGDKVNFSPRGDNVNASLRCSTIDATSTECPHWGGVSTNPPALLFYQVVGVCAGNPIIEGAN